MFKHDRINYEQLANELRVFANYGSLFPELIRAYYYDAKLKAEDTDVSRVITNDLDPIDQDMLSDEYDKLRIMLLNQEEYFKKIKQIDYFEVRVGNLKKDGDGNLRQKGVDTLIAIDMITKAYEDHYDVAVLLAGDEDFLNVVNAVKNTGRRVFGAYFKDHISKDLEESFDKRKILDKGFMTPLEQKSTV